IPKIPRGRTSLAAGTAAQTESSFSRKVRKGRKDFSTPFLATVALNRRNRRDAPSVLGWVADGVVEMQDDVVAEAAMELPTATGA
ncbi:MAG: hypothetical protein IIZ06_01735, partial [Kiritimatiellae bacterium]|nr:hypothetical protein [Kiritimatiellia bacterium]